jgi:hypothetical protein
MNKPTNISELISYLTVNPRVVFVIKDDKGVCSHISHRIFKEFKNNRIYWDEPACGERFTPLVQCDDVCFKVNIEFHDDEFAVVLRDETRQVVVFHFEYRN